LRPLGCDRPSWAQGETEGLIDGGHAGGKYPAGLREDLRGFLAR